MDSEVFLEFEGPYEGRYLRIDGINRNSNLIIRVDRSITFISDKTKTDLIERERERVVQRNLIYCSSSVVEISTTPKGKRRERIAFMLADDFNAYYDMTVTDHKIQWVEIKRQAGKDEEILGSEMSFEQKQHYHNIREIALMRHKESEKG